MIRDSATCSARNVRDSARTIAGSSLARNADLLETRHIHPTASASWKSESFHIIEGELEILLFDDDGTIHEVIPMGTYQSGRVFFYRLAEPCFHSVLVNTSYVLFHETTNGPFNAADTEFAQWAPMERTAGAIEYVSRLRARRDT